MNPYEVLGVSENATKEEIKDAYKKLSKVHHPDAGGDEERFKRIASAYAILNDDEKRAKYDQLGIIDDTIDSIEHIMSFIEDKIINPFLKNPDGNFFHEAFALIREAKQNAGNTIVELDKIITTLSRIKKRFIKKDDSVNLFEKLIEDKHKQFSKEKERIKDMRLKLDEINEELKTYSYNPRDFEGIEMNHG